MKNVFITGITGLLGTNLALDLLAKGYTVKALLRNKKSYTLIDHHNLELIQGNLFDILDQHLTQVDVCIHIAAETAQHYTDYERYQRINVEASKHLQESCIRTGVKKFVFISSANSLGFGTLTNPGDQYTPLKKPFTDSFYAQSKREAEVCLLKNTDKIHTIILNPTFMLGPYDRKPSSGKIILMAWKKKIIFSPPGGKNFVNVKDVVKAINNSLLSGRNGEKYLIANENLSYHTFFTKLNTLTNQSPIIVNIPKPLLISIGYLGDLLRKLGVQTSLSSTNMKILCIGNYYDNAKSIKELKVQYQPIDFGIIQAIEYFKTN
ncbi:NAD-dependent epimerase/dehydratase family protein [Myroides pelagicus]|uniref:NAD-dependent epimerase/dehydratase family protein n=1 Tax=Myroides pelagicus TaxID=270914 RepID=A0A7K1GNS0_9FLAO|nr:NAD-dependent epimerase/dehydratase family protein [Myroides pelagicus]MEC4113415.1 NAD-dependent epimerase/dehydratase family protein [Myroides pelagicus]MTH30486.1 NAD-dependent epimerase/dehydratase family protein [Myroides pelagicus]